MAESAIVEPPRPSGAQAVVPAPATLRDDHAERSSTRAAAVPAQPGGEHRARATERGTGRRAAAGSRRATVPPEAAVTAAAWDEALAAAAELRAALAGIGLDRPFSRMRGDVNVYGAAMVSLGRVTPVTARQLAAVLRGFGVTLGDDAAEGDESTEGTEGTEGTVTESSRPEGRPQPANGPATRGERRRRRAKGTEVSGRPTV